MRGLKKFDTALKVKKPSHAWHLLQEIVAAYFYIPVGGKVKKVNCEGLKPPYVLLSNHGSMVDFAMAIKATRPHRSSYVCSIEEFNGREYMFRRMGIIYKRKFTNDITVVRHILRCLTKNKNIVTIYPEARFSFVGATERFDSALGKLIKVAKCPVVVFMMKGNFLRSPQWNKHPYRKIPVEGEFKQIVTREEAQTLTADEIQKRIEEAFHYDDYKYQLDNKIEIKSKARANNIHKVLYKCPHCEKEVMYSKNTKLWCQDCGKVWEMDTLGRLKCENGEDKFTSVVDWYNWERLKVREEVESGTYKFEDEARLEDLKCSAKGFVPVGTVTLTHDYNGFTMKGTKEGKPFEFNRPAETMSSCHVEFDYKKRGDAIDLCTLEDTYFVYPLNAYNCLTKLHFATEELYDFVTKKRDAETKKQ